MTDALTQPVARAWWRDLLSERMLFGFLVIIGFILILHELIYEIANLRPEIISIVASGVGALATSVGIIVQAIWKTDKSEKQAAATLASLASTVAAQAPTATPPRAEGGQS